MSGDDDTQYRIVRRFKRPSASSGQQASSASSPRNASRPTEPAPPPVFAQGSKTIPINHLRGQIAAQAAGSPQRGAFGGCEIVVEPAEGDQVSFVLPGALRLTGTRDEAMALAAALLRVARGH